MHVRFGRFTLDTDSRVLRCGNDARHLSGKGLELLRLLIANQPRVLSKNELFERLWPATFVSDATLTSLVAEVRAALGERASSRGFIRTVHRFGYAFNGTVSGLTAADRPDDRTRCWIVSRWGQAALADGAHILGRDATVSVWLESPTVSRHHARISVHGERATLEDLGSKNGTWLRGERLSTPAVLADGDDIRCGSVTLRFRRRAADPSTATLTTG